MGAIILRNFVDRPRSSVVERALGKGEVIGSIPIVGSIGPAALGDASAPFCLSRAEGI